MKKQNLMTLVALAFLAGCGAQLWDIAHVGLSAVARATVVTDTVVRSQMPADYDREEHHIIEQATADLVAYRECLVQQGTSVSTGGTPLACEAPPSIETYVARWETEVGPWRQTIQALDSMRAALLIAEAIVETWRDTQEQPSNWNAICRAIGVAQEQITEALRACDVEIPELWDTIRPLLEPVCSWVVEIADDMTATTAVTEVQ